LSDFCARTASDIRRSGMSGTPSMSEHGPGDDDSSDGKKRDVQLF
jgi:hypothetical protein